jgi:hypothetical protein
MAIFNNIALEQNYWEGNQKIFGGGHYCKEERQVIFRKKEKNDFSTKIAHKL